MLLLDQENRAVDSVRKIMIISEINELNDRIAQLLRSRGLENIELINTDFFSNDTLSISAGETIGVIVDIKNETSINQITNKIHSVIPQNVWCCIMGHSDSISLAQKLLEAGVVYFNAGTQLPQMVERIITGVNIPFLRNTIKISVLGCKGGIGSSIISSHIANAIATEKKVPVLLAQSKLGSQDLDLLFDKKLQSDIVEYAPNLDLYQGIPSKLASHALNKYNFIVYDQPIFSLDKEEYDSIFEHSNTFVLVIERKISSLRVAKQFLDECERIRNTTSRFIRTFICISDHKNEISKLMATGDVERLLQCEIDNIIPYAKNMSSSDKALTANLGAKGKKEISLLAMKAIGALSRNGVKQGGQSGLATFFKKLFK